MDALEKDRLPQAFRVKEITLREGFRAPDQICTPRIGAAELTYPDAIISHPKFTKLQTVNILPDFPTSFHPLVFPTPIFQFGLQLLRTPLTRFNYGMPLESTTNSSSRQQLKILQPRYLDLTFVTPTIELFTELKDLVSSTTQCLSIRYVAVRGVPNASLFLCEPLQAFKRINIYLNLPRPRRRIAGTGNDRHIVDEPDPAGERLVTNLVAAMEIADEDVQARYRIFKVDDWDVAGQVHSAPRTRLWPLHDLEDESKAPSSQLAIMDTKDTLTTGEPTGAGPSVTKTKSESWERQTNLRLLGGLINLRLESKKR